MSRCFARSAPLLRTKQRIFEMVLAFLILNVTRDAAGMNVTKEEWVRNSWNPMKPGGILFRVQCDALWKNNSPSIFDNFAFIFSLSFFLTKWLYTSYTQALSVMMPVTPQTVICCNFTCAEMWLKCIGTHAHETLWVVTAAKSRAILFSRENKLFIRLLTGKKRKWPKIKSVDWKNWPGGGFSS